ncbi:EAL domain-containing response regulator [Montanilutibacter psychrotolerans]|nr:EAL domain-containing response regulator [Lysobacter psychrotolerans]
MKHHVRHCMTPGVHAIAAPHGQEPPKSFAGRHAIGAHNEAARSPPPCSLLPVASMQRDLDVNGVGCHKRLRTIVIDDDPFFVELLCALLRDAGLNEIDVATSGDDALSKIGPTPPDLLVCDLNMPTMDGVQLLQAVASLGVRPSIILVSGEDVRVLDATRRFAEAIGLPVLGVLSKPISSDALLDLLRQYRPQPVPQEDHEVTISMEARQLMSGLKTGAMHLAYQPKVELATGALYGVECLLRWEDAQIGSISPRDVVTAAEKSGVINELTLAILDQVAIDHAAMEHSGVRTNCAVNLSMRSLYEVEMVDRMKAALAAEGGLFRDYTFEVTETHMVEDLPRVLEALIRLRLSGFSVSIDDYGTGASTMQMLAQLPSSELKIDRSFVAAGVRSEEGRLFLRSAIELGLGLNQTIVAEGVEIQKEHELAHQLGCHLGQGFLYARPMPLDELLTWVRDRG